MKILIVHNIIAPYRTPLFEELSKKHDIYVVFLEQKDKDRKWSQDSSQLSFKNSFLPSIKIKILGKNIIVNYGLKKVFKKFNPDLLICLDDPRYFMSSLLFLFYAKLMKKPVVLWTGAFEQYSLGKSSLVRCLVFSYNFIFRKLLYSFADSFWAYSQGTSDYLIKQFKVNKEKIFVGLQGYPDKMIPFHIVGHDFKKRFEDNIILFVGYFNDRKGIPLLIDAFLHFSTFHPNYKLQLVGTGALADVLAVQYEDEDKISFAGYVDGEAKYKLIDQAKVLVVPSSSEPWGWVVQEAASCKLPVIVSDAVMAKDIVDCDELIFESGSFSSLLKTLFFLGDMSFDDYRSFSMRSYSCSRNHTLSKAFHSFDKIISYLS